MRGGESHVFAYQNGAACALSQSRRVSNVERDVRLELAVTGELAVQNSGRVPLLRAASFVCAVQSPVSCESAVFEGEVWLDLRLSRRSSAIGWPAIHI